MKKRIFFLALVAMLGTQFAGAQRRADKPCTPEQMVERLDRKLDLSEEQKKSIKVFCEEFLKQERVNVREQRRELRKELDENIESVLTAEQKVLFQEQKVNGGPGKLNRKCR